MKKKIMSNVIVCLLVAGIVSVIGVGAATLFASSDVVYDNTNSGAVSTDVQGALDELYELANNPEYYDPYAVGTPVYYNPVDGAKCFDYVSTNSESENNTGCMKWYIIGEDTDTIDMILDHNTTGFVSPYLRDEEPVPDVLLTELNTDTSGWTGVPARTDTYTDPLNGYTINYSGYRARLIEANEIAKITGADKALGWNSATATYGYYFDGKYGTDSTWQTQVVTTQGASKYAWLFDYTNYSTSYGGNINEESLMVDGYWTSSAVADCGSNSDCFYCVSYASELWSRAFTNYTNTFGLRPVITIPKP